MFPQELTIIAARAAMGKTVLALNVAENAARAGNRVLFFSLEMPRKQLAMRILARKTGISTERQREGTVTGTESGRLIAAARDLQNIPLVIDDRAGLNAAQIRTRTRREIRRGGVDLVVIDYLTLMGMDTRAPSRTYQIEETTKALKAMAKDLDIPVVLLAQVSRGVESRDDKRPGLADLKDSGAIEQDADGVLFIYRHEYYLERARPQRGSNEKPDAFDRRMLDWENDLHSSRGKAEIIIAKYRQGKTGTVQVHFDEVRQCFENLAHEGHEHWGRG